MDIQLKRGMLEACVLKVLSTGDSYGYQIVKDILPYTQISESTLYPILKRLEASGAVSVYTMEYNSRLRKYYKITPNGTQRIANFIDEWQEVMQIYHFITHCGKEQDHE